MLFRSSSEICLQHLYSCQHSSHHMCDELTDRPGSVSSPDIQNMVMSLRWNGTPKERIFSLGLQNCIPSAISISLYHSLVSAKEVRSTLYDQLPWTQTVYRRLEQYSCYLEHTADHAPYDLDIWRRRLKAFPDNPRRLHPRRQSRCNHRPVVPWKSGLPTRLLESLDAEVAGDHMRDADRKSVV